MFGLSDSEATILNLPDEALIEIATKCGVEAVVRLEQTCRQLRDQISQKPFWVALLRCLPNEHSPKLRADVLIETLDAGALRKIVVGAVRRYKNWNGAHPCVTHSDIIKLPGSGAARGSIVHASLFEDGLYVAVLWLLGMLEIRRAVGGEIIWTYPLDVNDHNRDIETYAIDRVKDNGAVKLHVLLIGICERRPSRNGSIIRIRSVKVFKLDLVSGESEQKFSDIIEVSTATSSVTCQLRGRLAAIFDVRSAVILNWETGENFGLSKARLESFELTNDYIIVFLRTLLAGPGSDECFFLVIIDVFRAFQSLHQEVSNAIIPADRVINLDAPPSGSSPFMICYEKISVRRGSRAYSWTLSFASLRTLKAHWRREIATEIRLYAMFRNRFAFDRPVEPCVLVKRKFTLTPPKGTSLPATVVPGSESEMYSSHNLSVKALLSPFPGRALCISDHQSFCEVEGCSEYAPYSLHRTVLDREAETADSSRLELSPCEERRVVCANLQEYNPASMLELWKYRGVPFAIQMLDGFVYTDNYSGAILIPLLAFNFDKEGVKLEEEWSLKVAYFD